MVKTAKLEECFMNSMTKKIMIYSLAGIIQVGIGATMIEASPLQIESSQPIVQLNRHGEQREHDEWRRHEIERHDREMRRHPHESEREWRERQHRENERHEHERHEYERHHHGFHW